MTNCTWFRNTIFSFCWRNFPGSYGHSIRRAALALQIAEGDYHPMHILHCCVYADGFDDGNSVGALFGGEKLIAIVLKVMALTMETLLMMFVVENSDSDCFDIDGVDGDGKIITECTMHISKC